MIDQQAVLDATTKNLQTALTRKNIHGLFKLVYNTAPCGRSATYVSLGNGYGVKFYFNRRTRDITYERQRKAAKLGLGPEVGQRIEVGKDYGYITEEVETTYKSPELYEYCYTSNGVNEQKELENQLFDKMGFNFYDSYPSNIGWKNGKMICIDFE